MFPENKSKSIINDAERKHLVEEISRIKEVLDSFKYGRLGVSQEDKGTTCAVLE